MQSANQATAPVRMANGPALEDATLLEMRQRYLLYFLLALGVFFRLFHFFNNRSFFTDELFLNVNIIKFNFWQLATEPFDYQQKAPLGYLWASRLFVLLFGTKEPALRLFPLLCGIGALFAFVPVARHFLSSWAAVLAVGLLALAHPAVYHAVEAKQYSTELCATVLALYLYIRYKDDIRLSSLLMWGLLGGGLLWFSFPAIFVLAGIGGAVCLMALLRKDGRRLLLYLIPCALWLLSFGLIYYFFVSKYHDSGWLTYFFKVMYNAYPPHDSPVAFAKWLMTKSYDFMSHPLGLMINVNPTSSNNLNQFGLAQSAKLVWLYLLLIGIGAYAIFRKDKPYFLVLSLTVAFTLAAAALSQYPFHQRFTLFLAPIGILVLAAGAEQAGRYFGYLGANRFAGYAFAVLLVGPSLINSTQQAVNTDSFYNRTYYRDIFEFINDHFQEGDVVYVFWNMRQGYDYYKQAYHLKYDAVLGSYMKDESHNQAEYLENLKPDFASFKGRKRLWFVHDLYFFDGIGEYVGRPAWYPNKALPPEQLLNRYFSTLGHKIEPYGNIKFGETALRVTLYELNP